MLVADNGCSRRLRVPALTRWARRVVESVQCCAGECGGGAEALPPCYAAKNVRRPLAPPATIMLYYPPTNATAGVTGWRKSFR